MDLPPPPQDTDLRNIIDKLAQFVARNGPEFEQMTKSKQKGNPKFQFLYGGEYYNYYQYKVSAEQTILRQQGIIGNTQAMNTPPWNPQPPAIAHNNNASVEHLTQEQDNLREQIRQSEQNLSAQHAVLMQQQQAQVEVLISKFEKENLKKMAEDSGIDLCNLEGILQPIIDSCTKDSISNGKAWILNHVTNEAQADCVAYCLLLKVLHGSVPFLQKLHIIYLVNDVLHHCARKNADELKKSLENVVVPMFCNTNVGATEDQRNKLDKLLKLWESKANYLAPATVEKLRHPAVSFQQYQAQQLAKYATEAAHMAQQTKATFEGYQAQHQAFVSHAMQQILALQQQKQNLETENPPSKPTPTITQNIPPSKISQPPNNINQPIPLENLNPPPPNINIPSLMHNAPHKTPNNLSHMNIPPASLPPLIPPNSVTEAFLPPINPTVPPPLMSQPPNGLEQLPFNQPPPVFLPGGFPDFSKPPPGFPAPPTPEVVEELMPSVPYYDLPAGLMIPLIKLEDTSYKPLDPKAIRLPPPAPPSERLLAAVEAFYSIPSHDRPRDSEGWEKLGLYEYYKAKNNAKKHKEDQIKLGLREKSKTPSPVRMPPMRSPSPPKRRYQSKSPSPVPVVSTRKSRSRSPPRRRRSKSKRRRSVSKSRSRSRSPTTSHHSHRSPTPPSFMNPFMKPDVQELDESNKGHQMLRKMGWGGSGLGVKEQGIDAPISGGDVRDRQDQFKGVGMNMNDPYENFRKHKGAAFITRMKARAEERAQENSTPDDVPFVK